MALSKDVMFHGISAPNAYITVVMPTISIDKLNIRFGVHYRASPTEIEAFDAQTMEAPYVIEGENPIKQAYEHLKSLSDFEGCTDV